MANGVPLAKERIIEHNLYLVPRIARRYINQGVELLDLIQEGNMALPPIVDHFPADWQGRFEGWCYRCLPRVMRRTIVDQAHTVRLPYHRYRKLLTLRESGEEPGECAILERAACRPVGLDAPVDTEDGVPMTVGDFVPDLEDEVDDIAARREMDGRVRMAVGVLSVEEQALLWLRYSTGLSNAEAGARLCVSRVTAWQRERTALARLKEMAPVYGLS